MKIHNNQTVIKIVSPKSVFATSSATAEGKELES